MIWFNKRPKAPKAADLQPAIKLGSGVHQMRVGFVNILSSFFHFGDYGKSRIRDAMLLEVITAVG